MCASDEHFSNWSELDGGVHICSIHSSKEEQFLPVLPFFKSGFDKKEKCMYIYDENPPHEIYAEFDHKQSYPEDLRLARQLEIVPYTEAYTPKDGRFDIDMVIDGFGRALDSALAQGYAGLRAAGEMDWLLSGETPMDTYVDYEMKLNSFFPGKNLVGICQFDADRFPKEFLLDMVLTHPYVILGGKLYQNKYFYVSPTYLHGSRKIPVEDYSLVISTILEDAPLIA